MRLLSLPIGDDLLEIHNSCWTGMEKVYFNGRLASEGFSVFGKTHFFTVDNEDGTGVDRFRVKVGMSLFGVTFDVFKNDRCLLGGPGTPLSRIDRNLRDTNDRRPLHLKRDDNDSSYELDDSFFV